MSFVNRVSLITQSKNKRKLKLLKGVETQVFQHLFLMSNFLYYSIICGSFGHDWCVNGASIGAKKNRSNLKIIKVVDHTRNTCFKRQSVIPFSYT